MPLGQVNEPGCFPVDVGNPWKLFPQFRDQPTIPEKLALPIPLPVRRAPESTAAQRAFMSSTSVRA